MSGFPVQGASGRHYDYLAADPANLAKSHLWLAGGNFIFVSWIGPTEARLVYVGEAESIHAMLTQTTLWQRAQQEYGATAMYARPNGTEANRKAEVQDVVAEYAPPMNAANPG
jgi:hypothetical protein